MRSKELILRPRSKQGYRLMEHFWCGVTLMCDLRSGQGDRSGLRGGKWKPDPEHLIKDKPYNRSDTLNTQPRRLCDHAWGDPDGMLAPNPMKCCQLCSEGWNICQALGNRVLITALAFILTDGFSDTPKIRCWLCLNKCDENFRSLFCQIFCCLFLFLSVVCVFFFSLLAEAS